MGKGRQSRYRAAFAFIPNTPTKVGAVSDQPFFHRRCGNAYSGTGKGAEGARLFCGGGVKRRQYGRAFRGKWDLAFLFTFGTKKALIIAVCQKSTEKTDKRLSFYPFTRSRKIAGVFGAHTWQFAAHTFCVNGTP